VSAGVVGVVGGGVLARVAGPSEGAAISPQEINKLAIVNNRRVLE